MSLFIAFVYGTLLGSFFNVCVFRLPRGSSIFFPSRSYCPTCKTLIAWWQNIPVISFLALGGKCAYCGSRISPRYFLVELAGGALVAFLWWLDSPLLASGFSGFVVLARDLIFASLLFIITLIDWDFQIILDGTVYIGIGVGLLASAALHHLVSALIAAAGGMLFFYAVRVVGEFVFLREAMGEGDVKLAAMLGAFLGMKGTVVAILLSFFIGVAMALGLMALRLKGRKDYIPFGPAMALGGFVSAFWGQQLIQWYFFHSGLGA